MRLTLFFLFFLVPSLAFSAENSLDSISILNIVKSSLIPAAAHLQVFAIKWLGGFLVVQFLLTNHKLIYGGGDLEKVFAKLLGFLAWGGICYFILENGPQFIGGVGDELFTLIGVNLPSPGTIIASTTAITAALAVLAASIGVVSVVSGQLILVVLLFIFGTGMFFAAKIFMIQLELALIVMLSPLSFSLLGLDSLRDQGFAPLKSLISLGYRIILMTIILAAFSEVSNVMGDLIQQATTPAAIAKDLLPTGGGLETVVEILFSGLGAYALLAYLLYKSDSIAASLAGGSTSMGTADVASSVASGVAAGMAVSSTSKAISDAASKTGGSMSDFMKQARNEMGVKNAGGSGSGAAKGASSPASMGLNSFSDAPGPSPKEPNLTAKELNQMAKDKGVSPAASSAGNESSSGTNPGGGSSAGIGNGSGGDDLSKQLGNLVEQLKSQGSSKPGMGDRLSTLNGANAENGKNCTLRLFCIA